MRAIFGFQRVDFQRDELKTRIPKKQRGQIAVARFGHEPNSPPRVVEKRPKPRYGSTGPTPLRVGDLAEELTLSERQLTRRPRGLTGLSPNQYLQEIRLQVAREYFGAHPNGTWKEASLTVGFAPTNYPQKLYAERFDGMMTLA